MHAADPTIGAWIGQVRGGDENAADKLWKHCFATVMAYARNRMQTHNGWTADEEDIALSAIKSLCIGLRSGRYDEINDADSLWRLLVVITSRKISDQHQYHRRAKRDIRRLNRPDVNDGCIDQSVRCRRPSPAVEVELSDQLGLLLRSLEHDELKHIAVMKLEGYTNQEIAEKLGRGVSTVERKLRTIRSIWRSVS